MVKEESSAMRSSELSRERILRTLSVPKPKVNEKVQRAVLKE